MKLEGVCILFMVAVVFGAPNSYGSSCASSPPIACTAYCGYSVDRASSTTIELTQNCNSAVSTTNDGTCSSCDPTVFQLVNGFCVPHLHNSEQQFSYTPFSLTSTLTQYKLGIYTTINRNSYPIADSNYLYTHLISGMPSHFAVRIKFGIYLHNNDDTVNLYPLVYSMDGQSYNYNQNNLNYFSCYDVITSSLQTHNNASLVLSWRNADTGRPRNNICTSTTSCTCSCLFITATNCCINRYIQLRDLIVFISRCPTGCLTCTSTSICLTCQVGYILSLVDKLCYVSCPQATYSNSTAFFLGSTNNITNTYTGFASTLGTYCVPCADTCMQCVNSTHCGRCYQSGRNQSYLLNHTCYAYTCPYNYYPNMTNHTCDCPNQNHYKIQLSNGLFNYSMSCNKCAFQCLYCTGPTNLVCKDCNPGFYQPNGTLFCLTRCPDGQYANPYNQTCFLCDISCSSCEGQADNCTACHTNTQRYLLGHVCVLSCPPGYSWNNITFTCDICDFNTYSYLGTCITICPNLYQSNNDNRSCLSLSAVQFYFSITLQSVHIHTHGKLINFTLLFQDGLSTATETWLKYNSYFDVQIIYKDSRLNNFQGIRSLANVSLSIRNLIYSRNRLSYATSLPDGLDYHKSFQIVFPTILYSSQNIKYNNYSTIYQIGQHPELMNQYFSYTVRTYYHLFAIPFLLIITLLFLIQIKGVYELIIEAYRVVQVLGLLIYSAYPLTSQTFYFLVGCAYCNLDFIPNLYAIYVKEDSSQVFASFFLATPDMDFVRLMGSIILFGVVMLIVYLICRCLIKLKQTRLDFVAKLSIDIMEVKVLHSFWSSLLYIIANYQETQFTMFIVFLLAIAFLAGILGRRYSFYKETGEISPFFVWRVTATLAICFISMANELVLAVLILLGMFATGWQFWLLHSDAYLVNINNLNSSNYMNQLTFRVLNNYDLQIPYSFCISIRNATAMACPLLTATLLGVLVLLRDAPNYSVFFTIIVIYLIFILVLITTIFIYKFLQERRKYLVQNKLEYLQKKYAKLGNNDTMIYEQRRRPRVANSSSLDQQKYYQGIADRSTIKNFD